MSMVRVVKGFTAVLVTRELKVPEETREDGSELSESPGAPSETNVVGEESSGDSEVSGAPAETKTVVAGMVSVIV